MWFGHSDGGDDRRRGARCVETRRCAVSAHKGAQGRQGRQGQPLSPQGGRRPSLVPPKPRRRLSWSESESQSLSDAWLSGLAVSGLASVQRWRSAGLTSIAPMCHIASGPPVALRHLFAVWPGRLPAIWIPPRNGESGLALGTLQSVWSRWRVRSGLASVGKSPSPRAGRPPAPELERKASRPRAEVSSRCRPASAPIRRADNSVAVPGGWCLSSPPPG
jgi:hypothetical protein